jgi:DNA-binding NarL/FixJ family response regulator
MKCSKLSKRENEVMRLLCDGLPNKLMAQRLGLSVRTIEAHRASFMRKLGLRSLAELVRYALKQSSSGK